MIDPSARIHPSADLEDGVAVGPRTAVWHRAQVRTGATIGADCVIGRDAFIDEGRRHRRPRQDPERRARLPRRHGRATASSSAPARSSPTTATREPITSAGELARADDWTVSPIHLADGALDRRRGDRRRRLRRRLVRDRRGRRRSSPDPVPAHALVAGNPARRIGWVCACGATLDRCPIGAPAPPPVATSARTRTCDRMATATSRTPSAHEPTVARAGSAGMIPIARPDIGDEEIAAVTEVLRSGMIAQGKRVAELEERWAEFVGVRHAIAVANGTVALMCHLRRPRPRARATRSSRSATRSTRRSARSCPPARRRSSSTSSPTRTSSTPARIEAAITPRTKAICPVHLFGLPADMDDDHGRSPDRHGLTIVEDACQAHGATFAVAGPAASGTGRSASTARRT